MNFNPQVVLIILCLWIAQVSIKLFACLGGATFVWSPLYKLALSSFVSIQSSKL